ncbi:hypothetical protein BaOVIS_007550 [Babesia ovis]|uniref:OTU domain-containing protein n=1 Tax=Babesia ovis TaxID=5869 RepID=A0A9W5WTZ2_BABOV|nr:hypothetical protein BaOVIS_007550 [Babesia ovis]
MFAFALFCASCALVSAAPRWNPLTKDEFFNDNVGRLVNKKENVKQIDKVFKVERNTLAPLIYMWRSINHKICKRPSLAKDWEYPNPNVSLHQRFALYGMDYATYNILGDGRCLYNTVAEGFKMAGLTVKRLKTLIDPNYSAQLAAMAKAFVPKGEYYSTQDLMRLSLAGIVGIDPQSEESIANFDPHMFQFKLESMLEFKKYNEESKDGEKLLELIDGIDLAGSLQRLNAKNAIEIASKIHKDMKVKHDAVVGSNLDINELQGLFQFRMLFLNQHKGTIDRLHLSPGDNVHFIMLTNYTPAKKNRGYEKIVPHPCSRYQSWQPVELLWDKELMPNNMTLCRKNYGADGNCLFNAISGILRDNKMTREIIGLKTTNLPAAVSLSLDDMVFNDQFYTVGDLRRIIAVKFIGVDPHNENALPFWDIQELITKLEVLSSVEGTSDFGDITWGPNKFLEEIARNGDLVDIAKRIFAMLSQVKRPYSWGSYEDIDTLAEVFNLDIYLFWSNELKLQRFLGSRPETEQRPVLLLYYHVMMHFDGAGLIGNASHNDGQPIRSMYSTRGFPMLLRQLAG